MKEKEKGFTLVELLVVIAIIALLMSILLPSLARVRIIANRMKCGAHLADVGKSMMMYGEESRQNYPVSGIHGSYWSTKGYIKAWNEKTRELAFGDDGKETTVTSCFFLLIKYGNMSPKQFVCPDDADAKEFKLADYQKDVADKDKIKDLTNVWDFGDNPGIHCSYSYQMPFPSSDDQKKAYFLDSTSSPGSPLCADRNPYLDKNATIYLKDKRLDNPYLSDKDGEYHDDKSKGNVAAHDRKAQNVLYNDGHVSAEIYPNVGLTNDNIWKCWPSDNPTDEEREVGDKTDIFKYAPTQGVASPKSKDDACLVNEKNDNKD